MSASIARPRGSGWMHADARRGLSAILASGGRGLLGSVLALYLLAAGLTIWNPVPVIDNWMWLLWVTFFAWALLFARVVVVAATLRRMRAPGALRTLWLALAMAFIVGVVLPSGVLALAVGEQFVRAVAILTCAAMWGLALAMVPGRIAYGMMFAPIVFMNLLDGLLRKGLVAVLNLLPPNAFLWIASAVAGAVAWLCARGYLNTGGDETRAAWREPWVSSLMRNTMQAGSAGARGGWVANADVAQTYRNTPEWLSRINRAAAFGVAHRSPVLALRTWLGSPYAPLHPRDRIRQLLYLGGMLLVYPVLMIGVLDAGAGWKSFVGIGTGFAGPMLAFMLVLMFPLVLQQRRLRASAEYADLALLPALGDARSNLLRAVAGPVMVFAIGLVVLCVVSLFAVAGPWRSTSMGIVLAVVALVVMVASGCMRALAGQALGLAWNLPKLLTLLALMVVTFALQVPKFAPLLPANAMLLANVSWLLAISIYGAFGWQAWRRYRALPHPFLQD